MMLQMSALFLFLLHILLLSLFSSLVAIPAILVLRLLLLFGLCISCCSSSKLVVFVVASLLSVPTGVPAAEMCFALLVLLLRSLFESKLACELALACVALCFSHWPLHLVAATTVPWMH
jgi:hypothetical protein